MEVEEDAAAGDTASAPPRRSSLDFFVLSRTRRMCRRARLQPQPHLLAPPTLRFGEVAAAAAAAATVAWSRAEQQQQQQQRQ